MQHQTHPDQQNSIGACCQKNRLIVHVSKVHVLLASKHHSKPHTYHILKHQCWRRLESISMLVEQLFGEDTMYSGSDAWLSSGTASSRSVSERSVSLHGRPIFFATSLTKLMVRSGCTCVSALKEDVTCKPDQLTAAPSCMVQCLHCQTDTTCYE